MNLSEKERVVLKEICLKLKTWRETEPSYSCIMAKDLLKCGLSKHQIAGCLSSLQEKEFIYIGDEDWNVGYIYVNWDIIDDGFGWSRSEDFRDPLSVYNKFMLFHDDPIHADNRSASTYSMGVTKLFYDQYKNVLHVHLRRPGRLIGLRGRCIDALKEFLDCDVQIHEVTKLWNN